MLNASEDGCQRQIQNVNIGKVHALLLGFQASTSETLQSTKIFLIPSIICMKANKR